jgi:hypothetical protein
VFARYADPDPNRECGGYRTIKDCLLQKAADIGETPESLYASAPDSPNEPPIKKAPNGGVFFALSVNSAGL